MRTGIADVETIWFLLVAGMLTAYVVLDGFDLGAGILHLLIARTDEERRTVLRTIGPVWDGNEVWLIAGGGTLFFAFPTLYASAFSGFYLPLTMVLWLLILRGIGVEFRTHVASSVWHGLFDGFFALASALLSLCFGAALANVIRGVPLQADGYFFEPLWTDFRPGPQPGILDWYTVIGGATALVALALHGGAYVALKTTGVINGRARGLVASLWMPLVGLTFVSLAATLVVRPTVLTNYREHPILVMLPLVVAGAIVAMWLRIRVGDERGVFAASSAFLAAMLGGAAAALYPALLPSSTDAARDLTIFTAATGRHAMSIGLIWWTSGIAVAIGYFVVVYRLFRGKVPS